MQIQQSVERGVWLIQLSRWWLLYRAVKYWKRNVSVCVHMCQNLMARFGIYVWDIHGEMTWLMGICWFVAQRRDIKIFKLPKERKVLYPLNKLKHCSYKKLQAQKASLVKIFLVLKKQHQAYIKSSTKQKMRKILPYLFYKISTVVL